MEEISLSPGITKNGSFILGRRKLEIVNSSLQIPSNRLQIFLLRLSWYFIYLDMDISVRKCRLSFLQVEILLYVYGYTM